MICPKCGSNNVNIQIINEIKIKKKGCLWGIITFFIKLILFLFNLLLWLISLLIPKKQKVKVKQTKICVCQNCGHSWKK